MKTLKTFLNESPKNGDDAPKTSDSYNKTRMTKAKRDAEAPAGHHWSSLFGRYVPNYKSNVKEEFELDEAYMRDIVKHKEGDIVHPYSVYGRHREPHIIDRKTATKTVLKNTKTGEKYDVSHATGKVKDSSGVEERHNYAHFDTESEKAEHDVRKKKQHEKDAAHTAILKHLDGMTNSYHNVVGKLSPETHAEILTHLEKLKE